MKHFDVLSLLLLPSLAFAGVTGPAPVMQIARPITVTFTAPATYSGSCPVTIKVNGTITGPANQAITYSFARTVGNVSLSTKPVAATLDESGQLTVVDSLPIAPNQAGPGSDELTVWPGAVRSKASFSVTCFQPHQVARAPHIFVPESTTVATYTGTLPYQYPYVALCGATPTAKPWVPSVRSNLRAGYSAEKAYLQQYDRFGTVTSIGLLPEPPYLICFHYSATIGHYQDEPKAASAFFITAQHILGGPMYCITYISGKIAAGEPGQSLSGGPILTPDSCAALGPVTSPFNQTIQTIQGPKVIPH